MRRRAPRWILFIVGTVFFLKSVAGTATPLSVLGFVLCGGLWYWLTWRKTRELDAQAPRKPFAGPRQNA